MFGLQPKSLLIGAALGYFFLGSIISWVRGLMGA